MCVFFLLRKFGSFFLRKKKKGLAVFLSSNAEHTSLGESFFNYRTVVALRSHMTLNGIVYGDASRGGDTERAPKALRLSDKHDNPHGSPCGVSVAQANTSRSIMERLKTMSNFGGVPANRGPVAINGYLWKMKRSQNMVRVSDWNKRWFTIEGDFLSWHKAKGSER